LAGLLPLSHMLPVINAAPEASINLQEEGKPLTLNMEWEMTRPMLDFIVRLHKHGENPYSKVPISSKSTRVIVIVYRAARRGTRAIASRMTSTFWWMSR